jgi:hypothetical protein
MDDGFYWISFQGIVQIAFLSNEPVEDIDRGVAATGVWFLTGEKGSLWDGRRKSPVRKAGGA